MTLESSMARGASGNSANSRGRVRAVSRGGRGGGARRGRGGRARLPTSVSNVLIELGNDDMNSFYSSTTDQLQKNSSASRAFFPPLPDGDAKTAERLKDAEEVYLTILNPSQKLDRSDIASQGGSKSWSSARQSVTLDAIWDESDPFLVAELLPTEVRESSISNKRKPLPGESSLILPGYENERDSGDEDDENRDDEDAEDGKEKQQASTQKLQKMREEEEDAELADADYRTNARFDDDDGYLSEDSGNDAPLF